MRHVRPVRGQARAAAGPSGRAALDPYAAAVLATLGRRGAHRRLAPVLVAASGGPDSTALLAALAALRDARRGRAGPRPLRRPRPARRGRRPRPRPARAACAPARRPAPRRDRCVVGAGNVQAEARRARYAALRAEAARVGAARIATGHTRTDQAETVLLRLLRGAGARGLSGIPPRRGRRRPAAHRPVARRGAGLPRAARAGLERRPDQRHARATRGTGSGWRLWPRLLELNPAARGGAGAHRRPAARRRAGAVGAGPGAPGRRPGLGRGGPAGGAAPGSRGRCGGGWCAGWRRRRAARRPRRSTSRRCSRLLRRRRRRGGPGCRAGWTAEVAGGALRVRRRRGRSAGGRPRGGRGSGTGRATRLAALGLEVVVAAAPGAAVAWPLLLRTAAAGRPLPAGRGARRQEAQGLAHRPEGGAGAARPAPPAGRPGGAGARHPGAGRPLGAAGRRARGLGAAGC